MNDNETVEQAYEDIRKKIKKYKTDSAYEHIACMYTVSAVEDMIDRIEAAHQREVVELRKDNARLRAALKPVLEVYISQDDNSISVYDSQLDSAFALNAVREAKRIYNEGEERIASPRNCDRFATLDDARKCVL